MAPPSGSAAYKKKDGTLTMSQDCQSISWIPAAGGATGTITIPVSQITNLQQTPASNPKVMLKVFVLPPNTPNDSPDQYVFSFTAGANARAEANAIKDALSTAIQAAKTAASATPTPTPGRTGTPAGGEGMSAAMAIASAVSSAGQAPKPWDDDQRLKADVELQQSLLKADASLQRMFMESLHTKPDTLSASQFMSQFWSTRLHLLRAHAIERSQTRGSYNVLSSLKPRVEDNVTKLNISKEQIQLIFSQHPLVKRVYDENVPKLSEQQFWSRFFQSRLFKKLRGERISENDATDAILDKYLREDEQANPEREAHVPHFLDLAGNEVNHSQRRGNRPDLDMRPSGVDKVPIIRTLNTLSEKIMANVAPVDRDPSAPVGIDEETYNELQLRDLRGDDEQNRILLNIRDQSRFFSQAKVTEDEQSRLFAKQDPDQILRDLRVQIDRDLPTDGTAPLGKLVEPEELEDEDEQKHDQRAGSQANLQRASKQILDAIRDRRNQTEATSSGGPSLVESLNRAMERIQSVANDAEAERQVEVNRLKQHAREVLEATGKKIRLNLAGVTGGEKAIKQLLGPTIRALETALAKYNTAYTEEMQRLQSLENR
ncbi:TFIIH subunit TFB1 family protein [Aspergillus novofumigatus IBT 16806]|uniref:Putative RNA polymerase II transcription factor-related protein n=1 Tax=Aspergillus novofumigatus (strain IBT 16806) TaxID=1392255 RepID=A0A2I1C4T6_ASPN1|nr:putative RNA polymerase II transcription factor-related protein [Aspergillus novofumigatus IBT 16806]PKX92613.1 putative RNA polymerase II transcription factor-related protein [Aspergillus novofumigatus IBT 16806]